MFKDAMKKFVGRFLHLPDNSSQDLDEPLGLKHHEALIKADNQSDLTEKLLEAVCEILQPQQLTIFLHDPQKAGYAAQSKTKESPLADCFIPEDADIAITLQETGDALYTQQYGISLTELCTPDQIDNQLTSQLLCPISGKTGLLGWLVLGEGQSPGKYLPEQINLLKSLTHLYSIIYEKIGAVQAAQKQRRCFTLIDHIAAGINDRQDFDKFLTNVFEQINSCFSIDRFSLILRSTEKSQYQRQFLIEKGKKIISSQQPLMVGTDFLESNVIKTQKSETVTDNGTWFVTPLIAEGQTIGAISFGRYLEEPLPDPSDLNLAHAISNLITAAVVIHENSQNFAKQTMQLSRMQEINRQLNASFDLNQLLKSILDDAVEMLNADSGVLVVHDEETQKPAVQVTAGPIGKQIKELGLQIREGHSDGYYGTGKSIILNQIDPERALFRNLKPITAAKVENLISVPIFTQFKNLGSLELINKRSGEGFNKNDRVILEGIAGLAAIAIEKSAQSMITDRDLEERIEKLSLMHQIDRRLSATRDIDHALQITLESALIHTQAQTGTIGIIDETFEVLEQIWQFKPEAGESTQQTPIMFNNLPWLTKSMFHQEIVELDDLTQELGIPGKYRWHYPVLSEVTDERFVLMILHLDQPDLLTSQDAAFLKDLADHARNALKNALIFENLHDAIQAKNEFISFISHELKNPLTVIKGYADILRKGMAGEVNEEQKDYLTTIAHNVRQMNTFIKDLSDQSQIETKSLRLVFESTPVFEVVYEVLQTYEAQIADKKIEINQDIHKQIPNVWCDRLRLNQILSNMVNNAIKYTPEGGRVEIGAEESANIWDKDGVAEVVHFWVSDNGYGISQDDQVNLFKKFFRGTDPKIQKIPGSGLGLRISKSLVEMMGGQMWFDSTEGQGSTFHFTVPI